LTPAALAVLAERKRQQAEAGWTLAHDDARTARQLAAAAACHAWAASLSDRLRDTLAYRHPPFWPWAREWWRPAERRRELIKAGALILAEIERLDRLTSSPP